jgi:hypothetical protein
MLGDRTPRRSFLARAGAAAAMLLAADDATAVTPGSQSSDHDKWLDRLTGKNRQFFDFNAAGDGIGLIHMHNYIETLKSAYGAVPGEINAVGSCYGGTTPLAWNDAMWAKYKVGSMLNITDPSTNAPLARNWYYQPRKTDPVFFNGLLADAGMESLMKRGALFLMCNNAFRLWVGRLAGAGNGKAEDIDKEIRANLLPGIVVVPAMVIAVSRAQAKGLTYMRT